MPEVIRGLFFTDKLRSYVSTAALILILLSSLGSWLFPKKAEMDGKTLQTLQSITEQMQRAANTFEQQGISTTQLNETLKKQLAVQEQNRNNSYDILYNRYGLDPSKPPTDLVLFGPDGGPIDGVGVQPQDDRFRGEYIFTGAGPTDRNQQLQEPTSAGEEGSHASPPGASGGGSNPTRK